MAPDYPGFGNSDIRSPKNFPYAFEQTALIIEAILGKIGFTHFGMYVQDYGGPVGFGVERSGCPYEPTFPPDL